MTTRLSFAAAGYLFGVRDEEVRGILASSSQFRRESAGSKGWSRLLLTSRGPLMNEIVLPPDGEYVYPFLLRESGEHYLLMGLHAGLVEILFDLLDIKAGIFSPYVDISGLVTDLVEKPDSYVFSAVFAKIDGGQSLRSVSFYGNDVGSARLFKEILPSLQAHRVNLRLAVGGADVLSIGSRGEVSFHYGGGASLRQLDSGLSFLAKRSYIDWDRRLAINFR